MRKRYLWLLLIPVALLLLGLRGCMPKPQKVTERIEVGYRGEARINDFKALELWLLEMREEADSAGITNFPIDQTVNVLFIPFQALPTLPNELEKLDRWLNADQKRVLITGPTDISEQIKELSTPLKQWLSFESVYDFSDEDETPTSSKVATVATALGDCQLQLTHTESLLLADAQVYYDQTGDIPVYQVINKGNPVIVLNDFKILENDNFVEKDHATFLLALIDYFNDGYPVNAQIFYLGSGDTALSWFFIHAKFLIVISVLLIILFILAYLKTPGPLVIDRHEHRHRLMEHIISSGNYLWRALAPEVRRQKVLSFLRSDLNEQILKLHPTIKRQPTHTRHQLLSKLTNLPEADIKYALLNPVSNSRQFTKAIRILQKLRNEL